MKKTSLILLFALLVLPLGAQQAKYVFYFIGDGMGLNQVNGTEMYLAEEENRIGVEPLLFTGFPATGYATTFSESNPITDSAAAGTALATGHKTYNGAIGVDSDKQPVESVAEKAKKAGRKVGIATSVSIDHATPSAFYAHQPDRGWAYEIALNLSQSNFDFFAGSGFVSPTTTHDKKTAPDVLHIIEEKGYTIARGLNDYQAKAADAQKMVLIQPEGSDVSSLPYAIDRQEGDLSLKDITESAIDFLTKGKSKGFFLMIEGGKIDWACHNNDAATAFNEVIDMNEAIKAAYEFYQKHPKETLIVVTADHETGGLGLGNGSYQLHLKKISEQEQSTERLSDEITRMRRMRRIFTWEDIKEFLGEKMGFWKEIKLNWKQERMLHDAFDETFVRKGGQLEETLYAQTEPLAVAAKKVMNEIAMLGWTSHTHTAGYVPVYAIGAGSQLFSGKMDNTDIPQRIAKAAKY